MTDPFERAVGREREARHEGARLGFRIHLGVYVAVQVLLIATWALVWATGGSKFPWFVFPLLGWGIGLTAHYLAVHQVKPAPR